MLTVQRCPSYTKFQNQNECSFIAEEKFIACQRKNSQQSFSIYQIILFRQSFVLLNRVYRIDQKYSFEHRYNSEFQNLKLHPIVKWCASSPWSFRPNYAWGQYTNDDHREDAPHFRKMPNSEKSLKCGIFKWNDFWQNDYGVLKPGIRFWNGYYQKFESSFFEILRKFEILSGRNHSAAILFWLIAPFYSFIAT